MRLVPIALLSILSLSACSGGRDVHGARRALLIDEAFNELFAGYDITGEDYRTFVDKGGGEFEESIAAVYQDGVFIIESVTEDQYLLLRRSSNPPLAELYLSSEDNIDLSDAVLGRAGQVVPDPETFLELDLTGLSAWNSGDRLELISANLGVVDNLIGAASTGTPAIGAEQLDSLTVDLAARGIPLLDSNRRDRLQVSQLEAKTDGALNYRALTKLFTANPVSTINAMRTTVGGTFEDVAQTSRSISARGASFAALREAVSPQSTVLGGYLLVQTLPAASKHGLYDQGPELVSFPFASENITLNVEYGDPFPGSWDDIALTLYAFQVEVIAAGATRSATVTTSLVRATLLDDAPVEPAISPVRDVHISQVRADKPLAGVGDAPVIAWNAPAMGTANGYQLNVYSLTVGENGTTVVSPFVTVYTQDLGFRFPTQSFTPGEYIMEIIAHSDPGMDIQRAPNRTLLPLSSAAMLTPIFQP